MCSIIKYAQFIVSNDSCAVHISAAVKTPSACIIGSYEYGRILPYHVEDDCIEFFPEACIHKMDCFGCAWQGRRWECMVGNDKRQFVLPCIEGIQVSQVFEKVKYILSGIKINK